MDLFQGMGRCSDPYNIQLKDNAEHKPYRGGGFQKLREKFITKVN